ncbi:hypothetical protein [Marinococcus halophilus]|uniref:hypothetical protein n=1 Tax=Marinococcus halophilus TaxID=1371 RepID=UPI001303C251|nr:hypothetical protein [Marinococcus halophilus]
MFIVIFYHTPRAASERPLEKAQKKNESQGVLSFQRGCSPLQKQAADENPFDHYVIT